MRQVPGQERSFQPARRSAFRTIALAGLAAPLMLSACVSDQSSTKSTASLAPKAGENKAGENTVDAYGYAPVRLMAFADGSRAALPSAKPDIALLSADPAAPAPSMRVHVDAKTEEAARTDPVMALKADVAERKATLVQMAEAVATASPQAPAGVTASGKTARLGEGEAVRVASLTPTPPRKGPIGTAAAVVGSTATSVVGGTAAVVGQTAQAVGDKAQAVGENAKALAVAAIDTTTRAASSVSERFGDTFKGRDTITGDAGMDRMIEKAAADNNIPSELAYAVVRVESHYNPAARGSGVYGLSQIQPATARGLGFSGPTSALLDPETNLRYGMKYLAGAWEKGDHDVCRTAMKYKGGHRTTTMSRSAATYCANVKRHMAAIERRRGAPNRETITAANERLKVIEVASRAPVTSRIASAAVASSGTLDERFGSPVPAPLTAIAPAAASQAGRLIAAGARVPVATSASERTAEGLTNISFAEDMTSGRGARLR